MRLGSSSVACHGQGAASSPHASIPAEASSATAAQFGPLPALAANCSTSARPARPWQRLKAPLRERRLDSREPAVVVKPVRASGAGGRLPGPAGRLLFRRRDKLVAKAGSSLKQAGLVEQAPQGQERHYGSGVTADQVEVRAVDSLRAPAGIAIGPRPVSLRES